MKRLLAGLAVASAVVAGAARPAAAVAPTAVGWWWGAQGTAPAPLPAPPTVPAGGFMVATDPSGGAVAALRFVLSSDQTSPVMTLAVADNGDVNGAAAAIVAYRVTEKWVPASAGDWSARPKPLATPFVKGVRSSDGKAWTFNLSPLLVDNVVDVVLEPDPASNFQLSFNAPTAATLKTTPKPVEPSPDLSSAAFDANTAADTAPAITDTASVPFDATATTPPVQEVTLTAAPPSNRAAKSAPVVAVQTPTNRPPGIAFLLLLGAGLTAYALYQVPTPAVRGLGPMTGTVAPMAAVVRRRASTEAQMGGVGRFARPRHGPPPKL